MNSPYADAFLAVTNVDIKCNNNASLLSSMPQEQLYPASVASGDKTWHGQSLKVKLSH